MDEQNMEYLYHISPPSNKNEQTIDTGNNMDESQN